VHLAIMLICEGDFYSTIVI